MVMRMLGSGFRGVYSAFESIGAVSTKYGQRTECDYYISTDRSRLAVQQRWFDGGC